MATTPRFGRKGDQPEEPEKEAPAPVERDPIDLGKVASVFAVFGIISLFASVILLSERERIFDSSLTPVVIQPVAPVLPGTTTQTEQAAEPAEKPDPNDPDAKYPVRNYTPIGPFRINASGVVLSVDLQSALPNDKWAFVEAELLDDDKDYIFSFGNELWRESGHDSDGPWTEAEDRFNMRLTIPKPGLYYIAVKAQGNIVPDRIYATISRRLGSSIPLFVFGVLTLLIGFGLNEYKNRTALRLIQKYRESTDDDDD